MSHPPHHTQQICRMALTMAYLKDITHIGISQGYHSHWHISGISLTISHSALAPAPDPALITPPAVVLPYVPSHLLSSAPVPSSALITPAPAPAHSTATATTPARKSAPAPALSPAPAPAGAWSRAFELLNHIFVLKKKVYIFVDLTKLSSRHLKSFNTDWLKEI